MFEFHNSMQNLFDEAMDVQNEWAYIAHQLMGIIQLEALERANKDDSAEADLIRDATDITWKHLTDEEKKALQGFSALLQKTPKMTHKNFVHLAMALEWLQDDNIDGMYMDLAHPKDFPVSKENMRELLSNLGYCAEGSDAFKNKYGVIFAENRLFFEYKGINFAWIWVSGQGDCFYLVLEEHFIRPSCFEKDKIMKLRDF